MWIGTNDGLNRYDGLSIKVYNYQRNKPNSLSNGWVNSMVYDAKGQLWIGTNRGLNRYNFMTDSFEHVFQDTTQADTISGLPDNFIFQISTDSKNRLWVSTQKGLVYTEDGTHFIKPSFLNLPNFPTDFVNIVYEDSEKNVWVGLFNKGLVKISKDFSSFELYDSIEVEGEKLGLTDVVSLVEDPVNGHFWVGLRQLGLHAFDSKTKKGTLLCS